MSSTSKMPDGREREEIIIENDKYILYKANAREAMDKYMFGEAYDKYYELFKIIYYDEFTGRPAKRNITLIKTYKSRKTALKKFNEYSSR